MRGASGDGDGRIRGATKMGADEDGGDKEEGRPRVGRGRDVRAL